MAAQTGTPTDYNIGSQVRTLEEAQGSVVEMQATSDAALAFQALTYGAMSLFGIRQATAQPATGVVTFATAPTAVLTAVSCAMPSSLSSSAMRF